MCCQPLACERLFIVQRKVVPNHLLTSVKATLSCPHKQNVVRARKTRKPRMLTRDVQNRNLVRMFLITFACNIGLTIEFVCSDSIVPTFCNTVKNIKALEND